MSIIQELMAGRISSDKVEPPSGLQLRAARLIAQLENTIQGLQRANQHQQEIINGLLEENESIRANRQQASNVGSEQPAELSGSNQSSEAVPESAEGTGTGSK